MSTALKRSNCSFAGRPELPVIEIGRQTWLLGPRGQLARVPTLSLKVVPRLVEKNLARQLFFSTEDASSDAFHVTIIPQIDCNMRCGYCIQNTSAEGGKVQRVQSDYMSNEIIAATASFIEDQCRKQSKDKVEALIFGGEPLLNPVRCYRILNSLPGLTRASMVTNATRLTRPVARRLLDLGVDDIQITFDGARADHDTVRVDEGGRGSFDTIVNNLATIEDLDGINLRLRVNITARNVNRLGTLVEELSVRLTPGRYSIDLAIVDNNGIGWDDELGTEQDVTACMTKIYRQTASAGFGTGLPTHGDCVYCSQSFGDGGAVINSDGTLASCWDTAAFKGMSVGNVWDGYAPAEPNAHRWVSCGFKSHNRPNVVPDEHEIDLLLFELAVKRQLQIS